MGRVAYTAMKVTDSALLGHVSKEALSAAALSDLWTDSTGVFLQGRCLGTLVGNAVGAKEYEMAGIYLQISFFVAFILLIPVLILWGFTGPILKWMGNSESISNDAWYYALVLSFALPARIIIQNLGGFFQGQKITSPSNYAAVFGMVANLVFGLWLVLGFFVSDWNGFGFGACPVVTTCVQWVMVLYMFVWFILVKKVHAKCWPKSGWSWTHITRERVNIYLA
jgi:MATE family multidrug resistance protein